MTLPSKSQPATRPLLALAWMGGALASFSLVAIAGREASRHVTTLELIAYRSWISLAMMLVIILASGAGLAAFRSQRSGLHLVRGAIHFGAQFSWLKALTLIPLAQLFALEFTAPLWVALLAPALLGERLTVARMLSALIGFAGVLVVVRPGQAALDAGTILALASAVGFALSMLTTKILTRSDGTLTILFYMFAVQSVVSLVLPLFVGGLAWPSSDGWIWTTAVAVFGLTAHFSLARAFAHADAMIVAPMDFLRLPLIAVIGVMLYREALDPYVLAGGAVVASANLFNIWAERRRKAAAG
jgi:drug/metabolite transporter (DMT)-like permease